MNLNQVTVSVSDVARSIAFYQQLGLQLIVASLRSWQASVRGSPPVVAILRSGGPRSSGGLHGGHFRDGELHGDAALSEDTRRSALMDTKLHGEANVLICPNLDAANILFNVLKVTASHGVTIGPILLGAAAPVHILTPSATMRRVVNMTALAVADAAAAKETAL